ncbi:MAG: putative LPS assembly protein LptD [Cytophagaceae bacterium]|nr:putative LPS assembly protein LptD [Cytophagaceae bacterium]MDW8455376.1 putative LPS assembly protein LptD [Cytophagaceae bacterium]
MYLTTLLLFFCRTANSQQISGSDSLKSLISDTLTKHQKSDSVALTQHLNKGANTDSSALKDSVLTADTIDTYSSDIETTIIYTADDSLVMDVTNKKVYLYGNATIIYDDKKLQADQISLDWQNNIVFAKGRKDSTGRYYNYPIYTDKTDKYVCDSMKYNLKTEKGIIHGIVTQQGEGYLHGDTVKRMKDAVYMKEGSYTTCNMKHPHFKIVAKKVKLIPDDKIVSGPFHMVVQDVPTPLGFFLGFFPIINKKKSGIIFPTFGEDQLRGFFFKEGGYYWAVNDYLNVQLTGDLYANRSWRAAYTSTYIKRYKFNGNLNGVYSSLLDGFDNETKQQNFNVVWNHATLARRNSSFNADVNVSSSNYFSTNTYIPTLVQQNATASNVMYRKQFGRTPFSMSVAARSNQNMAESRTSNKSAIYNATLPQFNFSMNRITPFKRRGSSGNKWYEKIFLSYQTNTSLDFTNRISIPTSSGVKDSVFKINESTMRAYILPYSRMSVQHLVPVGTTFKLFKYVNVNPGFNYTENWYRKKFNYGRDNSGRITIKKDTIEGFYRAYHYNMSLSMNTNIYGTFRIKSKFLKAIRHTFTPAVNFTYAPDFSDPRYKTYVTVPGDTNLKGESIKYFIYDGAATPSQRQGNIGLSLNNVFEAKVANKKDTTGNNSFKKINLLDNLSASANYNLAADSLNMSDINIAARTNILQKINISIAGRYSPYGYLLLNETFLNNKRSVQQVKVNRYMFTSATNSGLADDYSYNISIGTSLAPKRKSPQMPSSKDPELQRALQYIHNNPLMYVDFNIPWNLNIAFNMSYIKTGHADKVVNRAITLNAGLKLTNYWKIDIQTGYDMIAKKITTSNFGIYRDLHCWQMNLQFNPFGAQSFYMFSFTAKSALLQQLRITKRSSGYLF